MNFYLIYLFIFILSYLIRKWVWVLHQETTFKEIVSIDRCYPPVMRLKQARNDTLEFESVQKLIRVGDNK